MAKLEKLGSLWKRKSKDGTKTFLTGKVGDFDVIIFTNKHKKDPKHPDFEVFKSEPRNGTAPAPKPTDDFDF